MKILINFFDVLSGREQSSLHFCLVNLVLHDKDFRVEIENLVQEVLREETHKFRMQLAELIAEGVSKQAPPQLSNTTITDTQVMSLLEKEFPNCPIFAWCPPDASYSVKILQDDTNYYFVEVRDNVTQQDIQQVLKLGSWFRSLYHISSLGAILFVNGELTAEAQQLANQLNFRICKLTR